MNYKYIDVHSHLQFSAFDDDREEVSRRTLKEGVMMINVGTQYNTSKNAVEFANKHPDGVYAIVGLHPIHTDKSFHDEQELGVGGGTTTPGPDGSIRAGFTSRGEEFDSLKYKELALDPKVVGIGECGLDYYRMEEDTIKKQKRNFEAQVAFADEVGKPLMLHVRNSPDGRQSAYKDTLEILKSINPKVKGDIHFFAGSIEDARAYLDFGFMVSFTGVITFPTCLPARQESKKPGMPSLPAGRADYEALVKYVPLDMLLSETDNPYVAPIPFRGKRNEPAHVKLVVARIAEIKGLPEQEVAEVLMSNAKRVFKI